MTGLKKKQAACGAAMWDALDDPQTACVIERDDGFYLFVSREEMRRMVEGTGWRIARVLDSGTSNYVTVLEKGTTT